MPFALFYTIWEALQGIAIGVLIDRVNQLPAAERAFAAAIALRRHAGAPLAAPVLLGLAGFLITAHPPPIGPTGLALFIIAVLLLVRAQSGDRAAVPPPQLATA